MSVRPATTADLPLLGPLEDTGDRQFTDLFGDLGWPAATPGEERAGVPGFLLVAGGAVGSLALMRALLLIEHPGRELALLLRELRDDSAAALAASRHPDPNHPQTLRTRLARLDDVAQGITRWQQDNPTARYVAADETTFASLVLEARIDVEQACAELVRDADADADPVDD